MYKQQDMFSRGKFGMSCADDYEKWKLWKVKYNLRKNWGLEPMNTEWEMNHNFHKIMRDAAGAVVDSSEPLIPTVHYLSNNLYHRRLANQVRYERQNAVILKNIQQIFVGEAPIGGVDNRLDPLTKCIMNPGKVRRNKLIEVALENCAKIQQLKQVTSIVQSRDSHTQWFQEQTKHRDRLSKYVSFLGGRMCAPFELVAHQRAIEEPRPLCWMDIEVDKIIVGRVYYVLYSDICPLTAENFRSLCANDRRMSYQCSEMVCMVPNKIWVFGGLTKSIFGEPFPVENFKVKHDRPGILSMFHYGDRTASSQFMITGEASPYLDGKHVGFGRVIKGMTFLRKIAQSTSLSSWGKPRKRVVISFCGQTNLKHLKTLPEPRFIEDIRQHIEANQQWEADNPYTKLDKKYKVRKVKHWNETESSETLPDDEDETKDPGYDAEEEDFDDEKPETVSSWSSQWSYKEPEPEKQNYRQANYDDDEPKEEDVPKGPQDVKDAQGEKRNEKNKSGGKHAEKPSEKDKPAEKDKHDDKEHDDKGEDDKVEATEADEDKHDTLSISPSVHNAPSASEVKHDDRLSVASSQHEHQEDLSSGENDHVSEENASK